MNIEISEKLIQICKDIISQSWSEKEWAEHESDDWVQADHSIGRQTSAPMNSNVMLKD